MAPDENYSTPLYPSDDPASGRSIYSLSAMAQLIDEAIASQNPYQIGVALERCRGYISELETREGFTASAPAWHERTNPAKANPFVVPGLIGSDDTELLDGLEEYRLKTAGWECCISIDVAGIADQLGIQLRQSNDEGASATLREAIRQALRARLDAELAEQRKKWRERYSPGVTWDDEQVTIRLPAPVPVGTLRVLPDGRTFRATVDIRPVREGDWVVNVAGVEGLGEILYVGDDPHTAQIWEEVDP